jgi:hypothetical protein
LAAGQILAETDRPVDAAYELELFDPGGAKSELDIAVSDGARLWIGEATSSPRFEASRVEEKRRLERLRCVASVTNARHVVLATSGKFEQRVLNAAREVFAGVWPELHIQEEQTMLKRPRV